MAKGIYVGVGGVAHKAKKIYVGVGGVARKVKKIYVGVGGVAKPCYSAGISKPPTTTLSRARSEHAGATVGNYAIFGGGAYNKDITADAFNSALARTTLTFPGDYSAYPFMIGIRATSIGDYAIFGGGWGIEYNNTFSQRFACAFSTQLVAVQRYLSRPRSYHAAASNSAYAVFAFGSNSDGELLSIDTFNAALVNQIIQCNTNKEDLNGGRVGDYALFGPGRSTYRDINSKTMTAFGPNLVEQIIKEQVESNQSYAIAKAGENLIFWGGINNIAYAYTPNLVRIPMAGFPGARILAAGTSLGDSAIFAGGNDSSIPAKHSETYTYDKNLVLAQIQDLSSKRFLLAAASVGSYALFSGGKDDTSNIQDTVDIYEN